MSDFRKYLDKIDMLIIFMAVIVFAGLDYSNLATKDMVFIVSFAFWFIMLLVRVHINRTNESDKK